MKKCPQCNQFFDDENLFCLNDGTPLNSPNIAETQSFTDEVPTVFAPRFHTPPTNQQVSATNNNKWIFPVLGLLVGIIIVLGFLVFSNRLSGDKENKAETNSNRENRAETNATRGVTNTNGNLSAEKKLTETPAQVTKKTPEPVVSTPQIPPKSYAATRIRFAKGAISSTVSSSIGADGKRTFILAARSGQYLSAAVNSQNGCVVFSDQSANIGFTTSKGDNYIYLSNNCDATNFNLTVTIR